MELVELVELGCFYSATEVAEVVANAVGMSFSLKKSQAVTATK